MWWFAAAHANLLDLYWRADRISGNDKHQPGPLLDAGCGTGGFLAKLARAHPTRTVIGLDADPIAAARASSKSRSPVCVGSVNALPFADESFAAIFSADVLCHRDVDEMTALAQFHRCLTRRGLLLLNLPAYQWMLSGHDSAVYNVRRYSRGLVRALLKSAGFRILAVGYWNSLLFPVMVLTRKLLPARPARSDVVVQHAAVDWVGRMATRFEQFLQRHGLALPFGGSVLAAAVKEGEFDV